MVCANGKYTRITSFNWSHHSIRFLTQSDLILIFRMEQLYLPHKLLCDMEERWETILCFHFIKCSKDYWKKRNSNRFILKPNVTLFRCFMETCEFTPWSRVICTRICYASILKSDLSSTFLWETSKWYMHMWMNPVKLHIILPLLNCNYQAMCRCRIFHDVSFGLRGTIKHGHQFVLMLWQSP